MKLKAIRKTKVKEAAITIIAETKELKKRKKAEKSDKRDV